MRLLLIILLAYIFFRILVAYILPFIVRWYVNRSSDKYFRDNPQYAEMNIANLGQGGLGMTDRDYYFLNDPRSIEIRTAYENMIKTLFGLAGYDTKQTSGARKIVSAIETQLAKASIDRVTRRDPHATCHKKSVA